MAAEVPNHLALNAPAINANPTLPPLPTQAAFQTRYKVNVAGRPSAFVFKGPSASSLIPLNFFTADSDEVVGEVFSTVLGLLGKTNNTPAQSGAYYLSLLQLYMPTLADTIGSYFVDSGYTQVSQSLPSTAGENIITMSTRSPPHLEVLVFIAQLVFCLYKSFSSANFENFMKNRVNALMAKAGIVPGEDSLVILNAKVAEELRRVVGSSWKIRTQVLAHILQFKDQEGPVGQVFGYVANIIEWTEMGTFNFVNDTLVLTKSPVLKDKDVLPEVKNFYNAVMAVKDDLEPQFWRIRAKGDQYHLLDRAKFPTLVSVSVAIKKDLHTAIGNFATPESDSRSVVITRLKNLHNDTPIVDTHRSINAAVEALMNDRE